MGQANTITNVEGKGQANGQADEEGGDEGQGTLACIAVAYSDVSAPEVWLMLPAPNQKHPCYRPLSLVGAILALGVVCMPTGEISSTQPLSLSLIIAMLCLPVLLFHR